MIVGQFGDRGKGHAPHHHPGRPQLRRVPRQPAPPCAPGARSCASRSAVRPAAAQRQPPTGTAPPASSPRASASGCCSTPGSPFLELSQLAAHGMYGGDIAWRRHSSPGSGGSAGRECVIVANDPTVKGGTYYPITVKKHLRAQEIARENRLPCVYLVDSGGAFLPTQDEVFPDRDHFGRIFYNQATLSARASRRSRWCMAPAPPAAPTCRRCRDENVIVRNQGTGLPRRPAAGEGGHRRDRRRRGRSAARDVHCRASGVADHYAENDAHALAHRAPHRRAASNAAPRLALRAARAARAALRPGRALRRRPAEPAQALRRARGDRPPGRRLASSTNSSSCYGTTLVCGFAASRRLPGRHPRQQRHPVLRERAEGRALHRAVLPARRSRCCSCRTSPASWSGGGTRPAASPRTAPSSSPRWPAPRCRSSPSSSAAATAPATTACAAAPIRPRFLFMWPNARISVMGGEQAASVLATVRRDAARGARRDWPAADEEAFKAPIREQYERQGHPYYATARLWDDGDHRPAGHAPRAGAGLVGRARTRRSRPTRFGVFRM